MIDVENYIAEITAKLRAKFGDRLVYVGLQGSYLRGEATDTSDVDVMVVLDRLSVDDLDAYRAIVESLPRPDLSCGFICGADDLARWNPLEICHLLHTTRDCFGSLDKLVPEYDERDLRNFVKMSVNNLYHELCHSRIHADRDALARRLPALYKSTFFVLQNLHYLRGGEFALSKKQLLPMLDGADREVLARAMRLSAGEGFDFEDNYRLIFDWCRDTLRKL